MWNNWKSKVFILAGYLLGLPYLLFAEAITLSDAVHMALQNNYKIYQYKERLTQKSYENKAALGNFLPSFSIQAGYTHLNDPMTIDLNPIRSAMIQLQTGTQVELANISNVLQGQSPLTTEQRAALSAQYGAQLGALIPPFVEQLKDQNYYTATLTGVQPVFLGGKLIAAKKFASAEKKAAESELQKTKNEIMQDVISHYLSGILLQHIIQTRNDVLAGMQKHEHDAEKLFEQGLIARYHLLRAKVAVADAERNLFDDKNNKELALIALRNTIGLAAETPVSIFERLEYKPVADSLDFFLAASRNQPVLTMIGHKKVAASQKYTAERAEYLPHIAGFGKYEMYPEYLSALEPRWVVGVQASISLFNGFKKYNNLQKARHLKKEVEYMELDARQQVRLWVQKAYREMRNAEKRYQKLAATLELGEENVRLNQKRFQTGLGTSLEVIDAQLSLEKNKIESLVSLYDYYQALTDLYVATGQPEKMLTIWNDKERN